MPKNINIRLSDFLLDAIDNNAKRHGMTRSDFIRYACITTMARNMADEVQADETLKLLLQSRERTYAPVSNDELGI